jgi:hypothetical protein
MQMRRISRNAVRNQDSLVNDNGEYLSHYMTSPPSAPQLANHEQCPVRALLLFHENADSVLTRMMDDYNEQSTVKGCKNIEIQRRETLLINKITGLWYESHAGIESERLARSLLPIARHVYGAQHSYTDWVQGVLAKNVKPYICILTGGNKNNIFETDRTNVNVYEFLRYDNDEENCVISGPIHPRHQSCLVCRGDGSLDPILNVSKMLLFQE